jgi:hypothetical protein
LTVNPNISVTIWFAGVKFLLDAPKLVMVLYDKHRLSRRVAMEMANQGLKSSNRKDSTLKRPRFRIQDSIKPPLASKDDFILGAPHEILMPQTAMHHASMDAKECLRKRQFIRKTLGK